MFHHPGNPNSNNNNNNNKNNPNELNLNFIRDPRFFVNRKRERINALVDGAQEQINLAFNTNFKLLEGIRQENNTSMPFEFHDVPMQKLLVEHLLRHTNHIIMLSARRLELKQLITDAAIQAKLSEVKLESDMTNVAKMVSSHTADLRVIELQQELKEVDKEFDKVSNIIKTLEIAKQNNETIVLPSNLHVSEQKRVYFEVDEYMEGADGNPSMHNGQEKKPKFGDQDNDDDGDDEFELSEGKESKDDLYCDEKIVEAENYYQPLADMDKSLAEIEKNMKDVLETPLRINTQKNKFNK